MLRIIALALTCAFIAFGQSPVGQEVIVSSGPERTQWTSLFFRDGSNNLAYACVARSQQDTHSWTIAASTLTSIVDSGTTATVTTSTAHGLAVNNKVTISGATDADLNGDYFVQSVPTTTTFTVTSANVTDATYNTGLTVSTRAPRSSAAIWTIQKLSYTTTYLDSVQNSAPNQICDNREVTTGATKITYQ